MLLKTKMLFNPKDIYLIMKGYKGKNACVFSLIYPF